MSKKGKDLVGVPNHLNWTIFSKNTVNEHGLSRVVSYINIRLSQFHFSLRKDIFNHRNISCISFFNCGSIFFLVNIYSDLLQTALKYLRILKLILTMY